jgi:hypothetical protein
MYSLVIAVVPLARKKEFSVTAAGILLVMHAGAAVIPTLSFSSLPLADNKVTAVGVQ